MAEAESEINFPSFQIDFSLSTINYFASFDLTDRVPYFPISFRFTLVVSAHAIAATIKKQYKLSKYLGDICRNYFRVTFISKMRCKSTFDNGPTKGKDSRLVGVEAILSRLPDFNWKRCRDVDYDFNSPGGAFHARWLVKCYLAFIAIKPHLATLLHLSMRRLAHKHIRNSAINKRELNQKIFSRS